MNSLRATASVFGVYAGLLGMEHGYFEMLQGNIVPKGTRILAVSPSELPFPFGHEPAMTVVPNLLATGMLAIIFGLAIVIFAAVLVPRRHGGAVLFLLSIVLLLVGGGFGPMSLLIPASIAASKIHGPLTWWRTVPRANVRLLLAKLWPWCLLGALLYVPVEFVAGLIFNLKNDPKLNLPLSYPLVVLFLLTLITGFARESQQRIDEVDRSGTSN